jgi:ceramide glucosyltransferase
MFLSSVVSSLLLAATLGGVAYLAVAAARLAAFARRKGGAVPGFLPPVTVLKPLCGLEPGLEDNLRSFCDQDHPGFQVLFGVRDPSDPAIPVVERVIAEMGDVPGRELRLVVDPKVHGPNLKASSLCNLYPLARHGLLFIADSDMRVGRDYLREVAGPFADPGVGAVTCPYVATPAVGNLPTRLMAMYVNGWFLPSVLVALALGRLHFCFGSTMAVRREDLDAIGGVEGLAGYLADDYHLGDMVARTGREVRLSGYLVENLVHEPDLGSLLGHELRWARTIRASRPLGYAFSFIGGSSVTLALLHLAAAPSVASAALAALALGLRTLNLIQVGDQAGVRAGRLARPRRPGETGAGPWSGAWLVPVRDLLCLAVWAASYLDRSVSWKDRTLTVRPDGRMTPRTAGPTAGQ